MLNTYSISLPEAIKNAVDEKLDEFRAGDLVSRIWGKNAGVWTNSDEAKWLGWLESVSAEQAKIREYQEFAKDARQFDSIALLGMGGSSLCPEVLAETFGKTQFHILDSTDPAQIIDLENKLDLEKTLFIVASKSGSTLEPNTFKQYFFDRVSKLTGKENAGKQFAAITDPGSRMQKIAESDGFRKIFYGNPEIGGRFSALSPFGLAAGAAMGLDIETFLGSAGEMVDACRISDPVNNPGVMLGTILGMCHNSGRDKLTIFASPEIYDVGAWLEQLVAESIGKNGKSIIPIDLEPPAEPDLYSDDRMFVYLRLKGSKNDSLDDSVASIRNAGFPVVEINFENVMNLGQEFFRWEFATAVAGAVLNLNPFDQPDVEAAKIETRKLTEEFEKRGNLPEEVPFFEADGIKLFSSDDYKMVLDKKLDGLGSIAGYLAAHLANISEHDYFAVLAYINRNDENRALLQELRVKIFKKSGAASAVGFGPRFLHSTGQAYKGGANNGVFLQITQDDPKDMAVPDQKYSFSVVKAAQARGDFQVLMDRNRRALRIHISKNCSRTLADIVKSI